MMLLVMDLSLCPSTVVFGVPLDVALKRVINPTNPYVPLVLETCFNFIENSAATHHSSNNTYREIRRRFVCIQRKLVSYTKACAPNRFWYVRSHCNLIDCEGDYKLSDCTDVDVITSLVRLYIHDLPHSLFTDQFKSDFAAIEGL